MFQMRCSNLLRRHTCLVVFLFWGIVACPSADATLTINLTEGAGLTALRTSNPTLAADFRAGFDAAAANWSAQFTDAIVLNYEIDVDALAPNVLGGANPEIANLSYSAVRSALIADQTTATDVSVTSNLVNASSIDLRTNDRSGAVVFDTDNSARNSFLRISNSNAKAIGLLNPTATGLDATITFNENFSFDFDQSDGIATGQFDFIGVATHEIGHALGFFSGVDIVDQFSGSGPNASDDINGAAPGVGDLDDFAIFSTADLLRFSPDSLALGSGVIDVAFGGNPFTSIDGGVTNLANNTTGSFNGGGNQASHFASNANILGPSFAPGTVRNLSAIDLVALDAIGFDFVTTTAVPEPSLAFAFTMIFGLVFVRRRK